jgi:hypothetical protein
VAYLEKYERVKGLTGRRDREGRGKGKGGGTRGRDEKWWDVDLKYDEW